MAGANEDIAILENQTGTVVDNLASAKTGPDCMYVYGSWTVVGVISGGKAAHKVTFALIKQEDPRIIVRNVPGWEIRRDKHSNCPSMPRLHCP
ncbi:MAG: hypothetical protein JWP34_5027 [Massilia sp.]|nr:hypothetical protein [Massilia sp.]